MTRAAFLWRSALFFAVLQTLAWLSHALVYLATPVGAPRPDNLVWLYSLVLAGIAVSVPLLGAELYRSLSPQREKPALLHLDALVTQPWLIPTLIGVAACGVALHLYAKLAFVEVIDFTCITFLRFVWVDQRYSDGAYREIASMAGHLLSAFALPAIFLLFLGRGSIRARSLVGGGTVLFVLVVLYAAPIMSRSVLFFVAALSFAALLLGLMIRPGEEREWRRTAAPLASLMIVAALLLSVIVFWDRYTCGSAGDEPGIGRRYLLDNAIGLGLRSKLEIPDPTGGGDLLDNAATNRALAPLHRTLVDAAPQVGMTTIYLSHGLSNFAGTLALAERPGSAVWLPIHDWLSRLGLPVGQIERGRWGVGGLPLAGAVWYDYGAVGVMVAGLALGLAIFTGALLMTHAGLVAGIGLVVTMVAVEIVAWSGLSFAASFLFPFYIFAAAVTALLAWAGQTILRRRRVRTLLAAD